MRFWTVLLAAALLLGSSLSAAADDYQGFRVVGRHLYDGAGEKVVLMGVNKMAIWTDIDGSRTFHEIARTGANAIRIVWLARGSAHQLDTVITTAINNGLIPLLDCHDAIGDWSKLSICVDYWVRPDILSVIRRHERYLLINIANEADSGSLTDTDYKAGYELALRRMRAAGIRVPLVIDAPGWGGRIDSLQKNAPYLMQVDPAQNVMFSLHIYWPTSRMGAKVAEIVTSEMRESAEMGLPLIIGEFSRYAIRCEGDVPYRTIIEQGHQLEIGWFAWSWGPGNKDCEKMDMTVDGRFDTLRDWGLEVAITDPNSLRNRAVRPASLANAAPAPLEIVRFAPDTTAPDLVITGLSWLPETPVRGDLLTLRLTVENRGGAPAPADQPLRAAFAVNGVMLDILAEGPAALAPGASLTLEAPAFEARAGELIVFAWADPDNQIAEGDDLNNMASAFGAVRLFKP